MQPTEPLDLVDRYIAAIAGRDFETARRYLTDQGFEFISPIFQSDDPDIFLSYMDGVGAILHRVEMRLRCTDGYTVCHILDVTVAMDGYETQSVAHLARVEDGRITRLEVIFDGSNFHRMIGDSELPDL